MKVVQRWPGWQWMAISGIAMVKLHGIHIGFMGYGHLFGNHDDHPAPVLDARNPRVEWSTHVAQGCYEYSPRRGSIQETSRNSKQVSSLCCFWQTNCRENTQFMCLHMGNDCVSICTSKYHQCISDVEIHWTMNGFVQEWVWLSLFSGILVIIFCNPLELPIKGTHVSVIMLLNLAECSMTWKTLWKS